MILHKLIGEIYAKYGTVTAFAKECGIHYTYLSRMLNGKVDFRKATMLKVIKTLGIDAKDIGFYFFPECCDDSNSNT